MQYGLAITRAASPLLWPSRSPWPKHPTSLYSWAIQWGNWYRKRTLPLGRTWWPTLSSSSSTIWYIFCVAGKARNCMHRGVQISLNLPHGHEIANDFESQLLLLSEQASKESPHLEYSLMVSNGHTRSDKIEAFHLLPRVGIVMWTSRGRSAQLRYPTCLLPPWF